MKITTKDLREWMQKNETIRHRGLLYKLMHNGRQWFLHPFSNEAQDILIYHKARGVYGLETNRK